jgi:hypothetical protein
MPAMGNPALWKLPTLGILASGRTSDTHIAPSSALSKKNIALLSGCHSGMEEQLVKESTLPLIWMPAVHPDSVGFKDWQLKKLDAGNLLVVCPFDAPRTTRENALKRNRAIAEHCNQLWIPAARPNGTLEALAKEFKHKEIII